MEDGEVWQRVRRMNGRPEGWVRREEKLLNTHLQRGGRSQNLYQQLDGLWGTQDEEKIEL